MRAQPVLQVSAPRSPLIAVGRSHVASASSCHLGFYNSMHVNADHQGPAHADTCKTGCQRAAKREKYPDETWLRASASSQATWSPPTYLACRRLRPFLQQVPGPCRRLRDMHGRLEQPKPRIHHVPIATCGFVATHAGAGRKRTQVREMAVHISQSTDAGPPVAAKSPATRANPAACQP